MGSPTEWKEIIGKLASATKVLAEWRLSSGVNFYMYLPLPFQMGSETIKTDSDIRFDELDKLIILKRMTFGSLAADNDIETCRQILNSARLGKVSELGEGICVSL